MKRSNSLGRMLCEQGTYWQNVKFDHDKHNREQFAYDLKILGKTIWMSDELVPQHFKIAFSPIPEA